MNTKIAFWRRLHLILSWIEQPINRASEITRERWEHEVNIYWETHPVEYGLLKKGLLDLYKQQNHEQ